MNPALSSQASRLAAPKLAMAWPALLVVGIACLLYQLAQPLAHPQMLQGLAARYMQPDWWWPQAGLQPEARATLVLNYLGHGLAVGSLGLMLIVHWARSGRRNLAISSTCCWAGITGLLFQPYGLSPLLYAGLICLALPLMLLCAWRERALPAQPATARSTLLIGGWLLLGGLAVLWIADYAARGPLHNRFHLLRQIDGWWSANLLLVAVLCYADMLCRQLLQIAYLLNQSVQGWRGRLLLPLLALLLALGLGYLGRPEYAAGIGVPHLASELARLLVFGLLAFLFSRYLEWQPASAKHGLLLSLLVLGSFLLAMVIAQDGGPLMVMALTIALLTPTPILRAIHQRRGLLAALALMAVVTVIWCWKQGITELAPQVSERAYWRNYSIDQPETADSPQYALNGWLLSATPANGFGLGRVPWCGAAAHIGLQPCQAKGGIGIQLPSDFALTGLQAVWGRTVTLVLLAITLLCLSLGASVRQAAINTPQLQYRYWLLLLLGTSLQVQLLLSSAAAFGWLPSSGITTPMLSYGSGSLFVMAIWFALALTPTPELPTAGAHYA